MTTNETQYIYAIPNGDWTCQHLLPRFGRGALCGTKAQVWTTANPARKPFPGVALCEACKELRALAARQAKADAEQAEIDAERVRIKTFWTEAAR